MTARSVFRKTAHRLMNASAVLGPSWRIEMRRSVAAAIAALPLLAAPALAETTQCTEIVALPATISAQGVYCVKRDLETSIGSGNAITINANSVTIDLNGFRLGGLGGGPGTQASGIFANNQKNITIRNGTIRGFFRAIQLAGTTGSGHRIEDMRVDANRVIGIEVQGSNLIVRGNQIINTGNSSIESTATGIYLNGASNSVVSDNIVGDVSETSAVSGIFVFGSSAVEINKNSIFDLKTATSLVGVNLDTSTNISVLNNRIINASTGTAGINENGGSTGIDCVENLIRGFTDGQPGCDYSSGNHVN